MLIFLLLQCFVVLTFASCPNGTIVSLTDPTVCYLFQTQKLAYLNAEQVCTVMKGHLASVHSMFDNVFIAEQAQLSFVDSTTSDFWFGATDLLTPGTWSWIDGSLFTFTDWSNAQPQQTSGSDCGAMLIQGGKWTSEDCFKEKSFTCMIKTAAQTTPFFTTTTTITTPKPTNNCFNGWRYFAGHCYKAFHNTSTWQDAENACFSYGPGVHLVSIHSKEENNFVSKLVYVDSCFGVDVAWIGLYTTTEQRSWQWTDNTPYDFFAWWFTSPSHQGDCVFSSMNVQDGIICNQNPDFWYDKKCSASSHYFVCKMASF